MLIILERSSSFIFDYRLVYIGNSASSHELLRLLQQHQSWMLGSPKLHARQLPIGGSSPASNETHRLACLINQLRD
jgi:hypothetical protein